jgi:hypothetical protein
VRNRLRFFLFVVLAILLVIALDKATIKFLDEEHHQASASSEIPEKVKKISKKTMPPELKQTWIIPIYPAGDLPIAKPKEAKKELTPPLMPSRHDAPKKVHTPKKIDQITPRRISTKRDGNFPVLEVGYDAIGFSGYLDAVERVGHFFLISNTENGTQIGSEISLKNRIIYRHKIDLENLAVKRPHLVSDAMISEQLAGFSLPVDVQTDSIILVFSKPFDELLWDTIESALSKNDLSLHEISRIEGGYVKERGDVFLLVRSAERKDTGEEVLLNRRLRITLG